MIKLPNTTTYIRVRHYRLVATPQLKQRHHDNMAVLNQAHQYTVKYLEKTYGYKHLGRPYPSNKQSKIYVIKDQILPGLLRDLYGLKKWNQKQIPIHSQALRDEFLVSLMTNFGEYRKVLKKAAKMSEQEKEDYRNNKDGNNPQHRSWYRKGSLAYLRNGASHQTVSLPSNGQITVLSAHHIKVQDYGVLQVVENIKNLSLQHIVTSKIKRKGDGSYELQLVLKDKIQRCQPTTKVGMDWNMKDHKIFHTSNDQKFLLNPLTVKKANRYETIINQLKSQQDKTNWLSCHSQRKQHLVALIRYYNHRRCNLLTEEYRHQALKILRNVDLVAIEQLDAKEMRKTSKKLNKKANHSKNRHLATVKPYELAQCLTQTANRLGKTVLKVDSYKTSQVEYGTKFQEKHNPSQRHWISKYTGHYIDRDLNASRNILNWALNPKKHIKYQERQQAIKEAITSGVPEAKRPKAITPSMLVESN